MTGSLSSLRSPICATGHSTPWAVPPSWCVPLVTAATSATSCPPCRGDAASPRAGKGGMRRFQRGGAGVQGVQQHCCDLCPSCLHQPWTPGRAQCPEQTVVPSGVLCHPRNEGNPGLSEAKGHTLVCPAKGCCSPGTLTRGWGGRGDTAVWPGSSTGSWNQGRMDAREQSPCQSHACTPPPWHSSVPSSP